MTLDAFTGLSILMLLLAGPGALVVVLVGILRSHKQPTWTMIVMWSTTALSGTALTL